MHDAGTVLQRQSGYPRRRLHHAGSADAEQQVALAGRGESLAQRRLGQRLAEPDHARPDLSAAGRTTRRLDPSSLFRLDRIGQGVPVGCRAGCATRRVQAAMQVKDVAAAGAFMQVVDVLGDQPGVGDSSAQCGNRPVRGIRLDTQHLQAAPLVPAPDQRGIVGEGRGRGQGRRIVARPETAKGIAEGGNPAFRRHPGAREDHQAVGAGEQFDDSAYLAPPLTARTTRGIRPGHAGRSCR